MMKFSKDNQRVVEMQMYNKARDIDVALYNVLFTDGMPLMFVSNALTGYQNKDGGFGHALEIDNYNKESSTYQVYEALRIAVQAGFKNLKDDEVLEASFKKAFNYLYNRLTDWSPIIPSNDQAVCASWFKNNDVNKKVFGVAPTPAILGYTLYLTDNKYPYYKMALKKIEPVIEDLLSRDEVTREEFVSFKEMYKALKEKNLFADKLEAINNKLIDFGKKMVERDINKYDTYVLTALECFDEYTGDKEIDELIDANLDYIVTSVKPHGLWEPTFDWCNEGGEGTTAQMKWMGVITIRNLLWLRKFNRLEA